MTDYLPLELSDTRHGLMIYPPGDHFIGEHLHNWGEYSEDEVAVFNWAIPTGGVAIDAGAYIGSHTIAMARRAGKVFAYEPCPTVCGLLKANVAINGLASIVDCREAALGWQAGPHQIGTTPMGTISSVDKGQPVEIRLETVDGLGLERLDLLKADVEGMEKDVLKGAAETLVRCNPTLYLENDKIGKQDDLIAFVRSIGYVPFWHLPHTWQKENYRGEGGGAPQNVSYMLLCPSKALLADCREIGLREAHEGDSRFFTPFPNGDIACDFREGGEGR